MSKAELYSSPLIDELFQDFSKDELEKTEKRMLLAARIDNAIKAKGWKNKDLASALGKSPSEISKWLSGTHNFTADTLFDIERVLDTTLISLGNQKEKTIGVYSYNVVVKVDKQPTQNYNNLSYGSSVGRSQFTTTKQYSI
ncbi:MAG: helix-turn-helix transcriptional regulator [Bacteroidales bacterium]|nr:helix-turn-helix transcriptional regulator [Bacteroidales bacterium]MDD4385525.1 helix-turn-helix transcriptional regulator [Bacteroidales bacterium]